MQLGQHMGNTFEYIRIYEVNTVQEILKVKAHGFYDKKKKKRLTKAFIYPAP